MDYQRQPSMISRSSNQMRGADQQAMHLKRKADEETQFFWYQVSLNQNASAQNVFPKNKDREKLLFENQSKDSKMKIIDDSIPVERSGPRTDEIPPIENFFDLNGKVPSFLLENIESMKFEKPSPIQKHAVPFGLEGMDLICCSQTVRLLSILWHFCKLFLHLYLFTLYRDLEKLLPFSFQ